MIINLLERKAFLEKHNIKTNDFEKDLKTFKSLGINTIDDIKDFHYISAYIPKIANELSIKKLNKEDLSKISKIVYNDRANYKLDSLFGLMISVNNALNKVNLPVKKAYPQGFNGRITAKSAYSLDKWINVLNNIYIAMQQGHSKKESLDYFTSEWDKMEKQDFETWIKYYESDNHLKYKTAQYYPSVLKATIPGMRKEFDIQNNKDNQETTNLHKIENDTLIQKVKQMIGRINSIEKLFTSADFRQVLGEEYEVWLAALHDLKRKLQTSPLKAMASPFFNALIIKKANQLQAKGLNKSANLMFAIAQIPPPKVELLNPERITKENQTEENQESNISEENISESMPDLENFEPEGDEDSAMEEFVNNMKGTTSVDNNESDNNESDNNESNDSEITVAETDLDNNFKIIAQETVNQQTTPPTKLIPENQKKQTTENESVTERESVGDKDIDNALKNVTIEKIINKLEEITDLYRNRKMSRDLTIVDLMMQSSGIASFFPSLAEATNKAFDSNQYILTRIEDILSMLRGATAGGNSIDVLKQKLEISQQNKNIKDEQKAQQSTTPSSEQPQSQAINQAPEMQQPVKVEQPPQPGVRV
jgi:hypothetical protein